MSITNRLSLRVFTFCLLLLTIAGSCSKSMQNVSDLNSMELSSESIGSFNSSNMVNTEEPVEQSSLDVLADALISQDLSDAEDAMAVVASDLAEYSYSRHGIDLSTEFYQDDISLIVASLVLEQKDRLDAGQNGSMSCFMSALNSIVGIADAKAIYNSLLSGAGKSALIAGIKLMGKRVLWGIQLGLAVFEAGECMGWWDQEPIDNQPDILVYIPNSFFNNDQAVFNAHKDAYISFSIANLGTTYAEAESVWSIAYYSYAFDPGSEASHDVNMYFESVYIQENGGGDDQEG